MSPLRSSITLHEQKMKMMVPLHINSPIYYYNYNSLYSRRIFCKLKTSLNLKPHLKFPKIPVQFQLPIKKPKLKQLRRPNHTVSDVLLLMDSLGVSVPFEIYDTFIKECIEIRDISQAIEVHDHMVRSGVRIDLLLRNRFLLMFSYCGCMSSARQLFDEMHMKDLNSWAVMVAGYMNCGEYSEAMSLFVAMQKQIKFGSRAEILFPYSWILVCVLKACKYTSDFELGRQIHGLLSKVNFKKDLFISSSLINFYGRNGCLRDADSIFDQVPCRNTVVWTSKLVSKCREEHFDEALKVFVEMAREGVKRNSFTYSSVLKACSRLGDGGHCGRQVHANAIKSGLASKSYVQCSLVHMYGKIGLVKYAKRVFDINKDTRNGACWDAMVRGYTRHGYYVEAIKILYEMKAADLQPHESVLNELRSACGGIEF